MTRAELSAYIDNSIMMGDIVTENSQIYKKSYDNLRYISVRNIIGSVYIDGLFLKKDPENNIHLVYYDIDYEELDLGNCVDVIDEYAFYTRPWIDGKRNPSSKHNLISVSGSAVKVIQRCAFFTSKVQKVNFPNLHTLGYDSFRSSLVKEVEFNNLKSISRGSFKFSQLRSFRGDKVESVETCAFSECSSLHEISLPKVKRIEIDAFYDCNNLTSVNIPKDCINKDSMLNVLRLAKTNEQRRVSRIYK